MKTNFLNLVWTLFSGILLISMINCANHPSKSQFKKLVFSDEFNYKGLPDASKWNYAVGGDGYGNNEAQFYTKNRLANARVEDGNLVIEAKKENWEKNQYTSAKLFTKGIFGLKYGSVEVRAKLPKGRGTWPAIWMMSEDMKKWPDDGELDIMEHVGYNQGFIHASVHTKKYNHVIGTQKTDTLVVKDASEKFHIYRADWTPAKIDVYVDNQKYFTYINAEKTYEAWPFDQKMYLILNLAVGGNWGGAKGIDESIFPQKFYIDYVRIYQ